MNSKLVMSFIFLSFFFRQLPVYSFENGWIFNIQANVGGSSTTPFIDKSDLDKMGASYMKGMTGFVNFGEVQIGYLFGFDELFKKNVEYVEITNITYRKIYTDNSNSDKNTNEKYEYEEIVKIDRVQVVKTKNKIISGFGLFGIIGVGQGYAGQVSGANVEVGTDKVDVDVFFNVYYSPVVSFGAMGKLYFLDNRLALGVGVGGKVIADTSPQYDFYSSAPDALAPEVGTIIVDSWMIKNMNPLMFNAKVSIEYNQPVLDRMEIILGGYMGYDIFKPKYITMPPSLSAMATEIYGFDPHEELKSFYLNSLNYGIVVGLGFKM